MFQKMHAMSATDIWGVSGSKVGRSNGSAWTLTTPLGTGAQLYGVAGTTGHVWAVGGTGLIAHYAY